MKAAKPAVTYRDAGVDIAAADRLVQRIAKLAAATRGPEVLAGVGPFAAAVRLPRGYKNPVLLSSADGVGTKLAVARLAGRHDTIGIDLVAMNANDLITAGARPLFFLDYLAVGRLAAVDGESLIAGIAEGCKRAGMSLVGGETAEMPGFYKDGDYDLAGFCVGVAERRAIIDGRRIRSGDAVIGLESNGLHSNGYSLARKVLKVSRRAALDRLVEGLDSTVGEELMRPTKIYVKPVLAALERFSIVGMAHITGGGLPGNLVRVLPPGLRATIHRPALPQKPLFDLIQNKGDIAQDEMDRTFNCGIGFTVLVRKRIAEEVCRFFRRRKVGARVIGEIGKGRRRVVYDDG